MKRKINIDGAQNVEVSKPIASEKTPQEQLVIMEAYTKAHMDNKTKDKARREIATKDQYKHVVVNDDVMHAKDDIVKIIEENMK